MNQPLLLPNEIEACLLERLDAVLAGLVTDPEQVLERVAEVEVEQLAERDRFDAARVTVVVLGVVHAFFGHHSSSPPGSYFASVQSHPPE